MGIIDPTKPLNGQAPKREPEPGCVKLYYDHNLQALTELVYHGGPQGEFRSLPLLIGIFTQAIDELKHQMNVARMQAMQQEAMKQIQAQQIAQQVFQRPKG